MKHVKKPKHIIILGAGLAGLAAGYELSKAGHRVTLIEQEAAVGGLARTIEWKGFRFDTGPHRWYTKNDMVNNWMLKLLGDEVIRVPRLTRIYFDNKFFDYPIKIKTTLAGMGLVKTALAVLDYGWEWLKSKFDHTEPITLEEGYIKKFGTTLYKMFFQRYSEKLWGTSNKNISADWIGQRTRGFNIATIIKDMLFKSRDVVSFVDEFSYPENGIGQIAEKLRVAAQKEGAKVITKAEVISLTASKNNIQSITFLQQKVRKTLAGDEFISTIPLSDLIVAFKPIPPPDVMSTNRKLTYRDELQVAVFIKKTKITPDTWIYVHSLDIPFVRMMEMDNWSDKLSPPGTTTLIFEVACNVGDTMWERSDAEVTKLVIDSFIKEFGLITHKDIISAYVHRMPKEYPVYHIGYRADVQYLKRFLESFSNLQIAGRNGTFRYNNMDHSIEMGLFAAWNVIEGERKFNIDAVNIEREYLEEKKQDENPALAEDISVEEQH